MQAAKKLQLSGRVARKHELYSIVHCNFSLPGTISLSPRARRYLFFIISLVQCGYCRIEATMGVISDAIYRSQGQTASVRTLQSALAELEAAGYLTRRKCRLGTDRDHSVIELHVERFVYWTKIRCGNVIPCSTETHNNPRRQNLPSDDREIKHRVNSSSCSSLEESNVQEQRAYARSKNSAKKKHHYHPIVYTLLCCLPSSPDKTRVIEIACGELAGGENRSGIDWDYYSRLWPALDCRPGGRRETTARREIVPALIRQLSPKLESECSREDNNSPTLEVAPPATAEQVSMLIAALSSRTEAEPVQSAIEQDFIPELAADPPRIEQVLSEDERRVLIAARERLLGSTNSSE
jgi:hypothetical protein